MILKKTKNKLLCDVTSILDQYSTRGIGRYTKELMIKLIEEVSENHDWELHWIGFDDLERNLMEIGLSNFAIEQFASQIKFHSLGEIKVSNYKNIKAWSAFDKIIDSVEPDIYFAPHFERGLPTTPGLKHTYKKFKTVVVVHDVIPLINNSYSSKGFFINFLKGKFYKFMFRGAVKADLVLTNSDFSKSDIAKYTNIKDVNIERVYLGIDDSFDRELYREPQTDIDITMHQFKLEQKKYFLYDSGFEGNKGTEDMVKVLSKLFKKKSSKLPKKIVVTGSDFYNGSGEEIKPRNERGDKFLKIAKEEGILDYLVTTGRISDQDIVTLLANSFAYLYPSKYEGFGFGPVQAMAMKIPAIVNNSSCLPEIVQDGALLVDFSDYQKVSKIISEYLSNESEVKKNLKKGYEISKKYNWETTAKETFDIIKKQINK
jgi:glycosyltransferase involved in cell wall biosynthesis